MQLRAFKISVNTLKKTQFVFLADINHFDKIQETINAFLENRNRYQRRRAKQPMDLKQLQRKGKGPGGTPRVLHVLHEYIVCNRM